MENFEQTEGQREELEDTPEFIAWAKVRMKEMKKAAEDATEALGLPRERTFDVMRVMFGDQQPGSVAQRETKAQQPRQIQGNTGHGELR